jgi:hypothetical protein
VNLHSAYQSGGALTIQKHAFNKPGLVDRMTADTNSSSWLDGVEAVVPTAY